MSVIEIKGKRRDRNKVWERK